LSSGAPTSLSILERIAQSAVDWLPASAAISDAFRLAKLIASVALNHERELDDAQKQDHEERQDQGELDQRLATPRSVRRRNLPGFWFDIATSTSLGCACVQVPSASVAPAVARGL